MEKIGFRSLFSLFLLFQAFSAVSLISLVYWFVQRSYSTHSTTANEPIEGTTRGLTLATSTIINASANTDQELQSTENYMYSIDLQVFKSWKQGVVTLLEPEISRNCAALFTGINQTEISRVTEANRNWNSSEYDQKFANLFLNSEDCEEIRTEFEGNFYTSDEERSFPLAFSINIHSDPQQIVRFLKYIYRSHNVYCIHYDQKSNNEVKKVINTLAKCLRNVIIPEKTVNVVYGCYPILDAQLSCMSALLKLQRTFRWKYVTTLCGKELPLRTNREMVRFLKGMEGRPVVYTSKFSSQDYAQKLHLTSIDSTKDVCKFTGGFQSKPVPHGMKLFKTMAYFSLTPEFTEFVTHSTEARALYEFVKPIRSPEEAFYGTLLHTWINRTESDYARVYISDTIWLSWEEIGKGSKAHCSGSNIHRVCIVSSGDLHRLKYSTDPLGRSIRPPLFHNKYSMAEDHTVMDCMEELLIERNKQEYIRDIMQLIQGLLDTKSHADRQVT